MHVIIYIPLLNLLQDDHIIGTSEAFNNVIGSLAHHEFVLCSYIHQVSYNILGHPGSMTTT